MKKILFILFLFIFPFVLSAQIVSHNDYSAVENEGILYPNTPYQISSYRGFGGSDSLECKLVADGNYETYHFIGSHKKMIQPNQIKYGITHAWSKGLTGAGVKVCVIDVGYMSTFHNGITVSAVNYGAFTDDTHTYEMIGTIAARNDTSYAGILGNAYDAQIYVTSAGISLSESLFWGWNNGCRIFNISLGMGVTQDERDAIKTITDRGGIIVVSAGNTVNYIVNLQDLCVPGVVAVSGLLGGDIRTYSDSMYTKNVLPLNGKYLDFSLPQITISTANYNNDPAVYKLSGGSSNVAAQITGMFALLMQRFPNIRGDILVELLKLKSTVLYGLGIKTYVPNLNWL